MAVRRFRVLIVEGDVPMARRIARALGDVESEVVTDLESARRAIAERPPDAIVLDVLLPDGSGIDLLGWIRASRSMPVLCVSADGRVEHANRVQLLGAEIAFQPDVAANVRAFLARARGRPPREAFDERAVQAGLSPRQRQVLRLLRGGDTQPEAARALGVGPETVKTLVRRALQRTGFHSVQELLAAWDARGSGVRRRRKSLRPAEASEAPSERATRRPKAR